ncbi:MAG: hypothetical protein KKF12_19265 [Proteobacteria bacterium]|nr:hypothetical protein [Desulfobacula sp.]MBU3950805.1 hypothetical protein [Pseudomonadota bacterium]MBU4132964.1 hypothetical protein [Pseudomonadota bacterium]
MKDSDLGNDILILILDKLLIGLIAVLIVMYFQYRSQEASKLTDQVASVARFHSEILLEQRKKLATETLKYLSILDKIKRDPQTVHYEEYQQLTGNADAVELVSLIVSDVDPSLRESTSSLCSAMRRIPYNVDQIWRLDEKQKEISNCYLKVMKNFRDSLRRVVIEEYSYSKKTNARTADTNDQKSSSEPAPLEIIIF